MLLKLGFQDFLDDRQFKNTTEKNIRNYKTLLGEIVNYCIENEVVNVEDINFTHVRQYLLGCQERGNKVGTECKAFESKKKLKSIILVNRVNI